MGVFILLTPQETKNIMDNRRVLVTAFTIIFLTRKIGEFLHDDFVRNILATLKTDSQLQLAGSLTINNLKNYCVELLGETNPMDINAIKQRLWLIADSDRALQLSILDGIEIEEDDPSLIRSIIENNVLTLTRYLKDTEAVELLRQAYAELRYNRVNITDINSHLLELKDKLENLTNANTGAEVDDPGCNIEFDLSDLATFENVCKDVKASSNDEFCFVTGFQALNEMWQGGLRSEFTTFGALNHNYKSGMTVSVFASIARLNKPRPSPEGKKPALVFITLEDDPVKLTHFLYMYVRCNNDPDFVEAVKLNPDFAKETLAAIDPKAMAEYVSNDLTKNGFSIKVIHGNPSQWGYRDIIRRVNLIEAKGYHVQLLAIDYVTQLQSTGITVSVGGQEKYELISRLRAWSIAKKLPVISPLQLSSDADQLLKNGVSPEAFGRIVRERGYYHLCKTLGQPIDLENFVCKVVKGERSYISITRGKHRNASTIPPSKLFFFLPFPGENIPLLEDFGKENSAYRQLPKENMQSLNRTKEEEEFF